MTWGTFGAVHLLTLVLSAGIIAALYFLLRNRSHKCQSIVLGILSFSGIAAVVFNLVAWNSPLEYLPFHLCSLTALVLPVAVLTSHKTLCNLLLLWGFGALCALVVNTAQAHFVVFSWTFFFYYIPHTLEAGIILLLFALKRAKTDPRCILSTVGITVAVYTGVHFINLAVNDYCLREGIVDYAGNTVRVNYMYSLWPENPVLDLLYTKPYWYMFGILPIIGAYLCLVYIKPLWAAVRRSRKAGKAVTPLKP